MIQFVIQKFELNPQPTWSDVKTLNVLKTDEAVVFKEAINSLDNFSENNPNYMYRLIEVLYTTRSPLQK